MRIDNDFLTLMGLIADDRDFERSIENLPPIITLDRKRRIERGEKERIERNAKIDALVAKINAADDARRKEDLNRVAAMFKLADWHDRKRTVRSPDVDAAVAKQTADLTDATQKTNDALAKILETLEIGTRITEASRAIGQAMAAKDMDKAEALKAEVAALKKKLASKVEAKDAAPAPIDVKKWAFATGLTSTGYVQLFRDPSDTLAFICRLTSPVTVTKVRDELAGNGCGADIYEVRWNVSPKDADGEGR